MASTEIAGATLELTLVDDAGQIPSGYRVSVPPDITPRELIEHVTSEGMMPARTPSGQVLLYDTSVNNEMLVADSALSEQGVASGAVVRLHNKNIQGCGS